MVSKDLEIQVTGWYPEQVFLTVVFLNSTDIAVVIPNSTVKGTYFTLQPCENPTSYSVYSIFWKNA